MIELTAEMLSRTVSVTVKLFAVHQEAYIPELKLQLPLGATLVDVYDRLIAHPELEQWREFTCFGINLQVGEPGTALQEDEIVLPPVSGG